MKNLAAFVGLATLLPVLIAGCDKLTGSSDRYTISKDSSGQTIRLDKKTGEIAVIEGNEIRPLKDASQANAERAARVKELDKLKTWPPVDIPQIGARAYITTAWRDGKMFYSFVVVDLVEARALDAWVKLPSDQQAKSDLLTKRSKKNENDVLNKALLHSPFTVKFDDTNGFELITFTVGSPGLTRVVDDKNLVGSLQEKRSVALPEDDYRRLSTCNVGWH